FDGPYRALDDLELIGDDRWKEAGRAKRAMSPRDLLDSLDRPLVIEQDSAAAIDLKVDETGDEVAFQMVGRDVGRAARQQIDDSAVLDQQAVPGLAPDRSEESRVAQREHSAGFRDLA